MRTGETGETRSSEAVFAPRIRRSSLMGISPNSPSLPRRLSVFLAMMMGMELGSFGAMMGGVRAMARRGMGMMGGCLGLFILVMFGGLAVMVSRLLVMFGGGVMMRAGRMFVRHEALLLAGAQRDIRPAK